MTSGFGKAGTWEGLGSFGSSIEFSNVFDKEPLSLPLPLLLVICALLLPVLLAFREANAE